MADDVEPSESPTDHAADPTTAAGSVNPSTSSEPLVVQPPEPLPTMADLDRVASELDDVDARLAALDRQRP